MVPTANGDPHAAAARVRGEPDIFILPATRDRLASWLIARVRPAQGASECRILFGHEHLLLRTRRRLASDPAPTPVA
jgi:hypothetical protein